MLQLKCFSDDYFWTFRTAAANFTAKMIQVIFFLNIL